MHCRCAALRGIRDDIEKEHAFLGLCALLRLNPQVRAHTAPARFPLLWWQVGGAAPALCRTIAAGRSRQLLHPCAACVALVSQRSACSHRLVQGAGNCFTALCEAIVSWRHVGCEGLHNELIQLMQVGAGGWHPGCCVDLGARSVLRLLGSALPSVLIQLVQEWTLGLLLNLGSAAGLLCMQGGEAQQGLHRRLSSICRTLVFCSALPQGYKAQLTQMGQWQAAMASLNPAVQQKLAAMCQL